MTLSRVAWACSASAFALVAVGTALGLAANSAVGGAEAFYLAYVLAGGTVGGLVASRQPRNPIGWILCALALWAGVEALARGSAEYLLDDGRSQFWGVRAAWILSWSFVPFIFVPATFLLLLFPDGRLPSHRFRWVAWSAGAVIAFWIVATAVEPGPLPVFESLTNPYGIDAWALRLASDLVAPLMLLCVVASAASVVARARRASSLQRQQLKWVAVAACFEVAMLLAGAFSGGDEESRGFFLVALLSLPIAIGVATLRYRLYDIDVVINRTLVYVPLIAIIGGVSTALVPLSHRVFRGLTGSESDATIVLTTLLIAALVAPLRKRLEAVVEQRFRLRPAHATDGNALLHDPEVAALVRSIAQQAAREAVEEIVSRAKPSSAAERKERA